MHLSTSPGKSSDDKVIKTLDYLNGQLVVATVKKDGENTTFTSEVCHARSLDSKHHPSRDWVKQFHGQIKHIIPPGYRVCGENLYAMHSIRYFNLKSYFYGFSVWDDANIARPWEETVDLWFTELGITPVETIGEPFIFSLDKANEIIDSIDTAREEGVVFRYAGEIPYEDYDKLVVKWVRANHVQTDTHWMHSELVLNKLAPNCGS